jgi:magnesium transporter
VPLLHSGSLLVGVVHTLLGPILPMLASRWRLDDAEAGSLFIAQFTGAMIGSALSSSMIERLGSLCLMATLLTSPPMLRVNCRENQEVVVKNELAEIAGRTCWVDLVAPSGTESEAVSRSFGIDFRTRTGAVVEEPKYLYMRVSSVSPQEKQEPLICRLTVIMGENFLVTVREADACPAIELAVQRLRRRPAWAVDSKNLLRVLLQAMNDQAERTVEHISGVLEGTTASIAQISTGYSKEGKELGVVDLTEATLGLNDQQELVSRCLECQLALARAARHLSTEVSDKTESELQVLVNELIDDIAGVKEHFSFEHEKIRYLQGAVTNILNIKQNQIVKVFTIITAVFLPPTLVAISTV